MQRKGLPAIVYRGVWKKSTKGQAGIRWDIVVENVKREIDRRKPERDHVKR